jgi:probable DNA repair protein
MIEAASAAPGRSKILVPSALAAQQWERYLASAIIAGDAAAWETPPLQTYGAWLEQIWVEQGGGERTLIAPTQSLALWRRVIAESEAGASLIGHTGAAEWAAGAWALLNRWRVDPVRLRSPGEQGDFGAFLGWCREYRRALERRGWIDREEIESELVPRLARTPERIVSADLGEPYPARTALLERLATLGVQVESHTVPPRTGPRHAARLPDAAHELRAALGWASARLAAAPHARIAIVVPTLEQRADEVARAAAAELGSAAPDVVWADAGSLASEPSVGAAMNALGLLDGARPYTVLGRWLRSPFFGTAPAEASARARLDRELRSDLRSQLSFAAAYRHAGLRGLLRERVPETAADLEAALAGLSTNARAAPSRWAHLWTRFLNALGWQPPVARHARLAWQNALDELARLTPVLGDVSLGAGLIELERILQRTTARTLPLYGIHVLRHIDDVAPGYDAVWASGFTDSAWPEPARGNPLLPLPLQRAHAMPYSTPQDAARRSSAALERLLARAPELIVSWPARVYDYETEPSPAIAHWPTLATAEGNGRAHRTAARRRSRETLADPPPALQETRVPGGTAALGRQARCPIRAFCQHRLGARPLEPIALGVSPRQRGIAAHRAAELLLRDRPTQAELVARDPERLAAAVEGALGGLFGSTRGSLRTLFDLERDQLTRVLDAFLAEEARRAPFRVRDVERKVVAVVGRWSLEVRIDRIDELTGGGLAIIDYKTSERASAADWFAPRLRDAQLPLYAVEAREPVVAAVIARLSPHGVGYAGVWPGSTFPGKRAKAAPDELSSHLAQWRGELEALVAEFAAGDTRILLASADEALESFAPLTRIHEQVALATGTLPRW